MGLKWTRITPNEWTSGNFRIVRYFDYDHGNRIPRYAAQYRGGRILDWNDPVDLAHAKRQAAQYALYLQVRHTREQHESVPEMEGG